MPSTGKVISRVEPWDWSAQDKNQDGQVDTEEFLEWAPSIKINQTFCALFLVELAWADPADPVYFVI